MEKLPTIVRLEAPRELTDEERTLLDFMLTSPLAHEEIQVQAAGAKVVGGCDCRCPSVVLQPDPAAPPATYSPDESTYPDGRTDVIRIEAYGLSRSGAIVEVTLNVIHGRIDELEIWDGAFTSRGQGRGTRGEGPDPATLSWELPKR